MKRSTALSGLWILAAVELTYLFSLTERVHSDSEFLFAMTLVFATVGLGAITVFALPGGK